MQMTGYSSTFAVFDYTEFGVWVIIAKMRSKTKLYVVSTGVVCVHRVLVAPW